MTHSLSLVSTLSTANATLPLRPLGYKPHESFETKSFSNETTLTFLDDHNLVCTFDLHGLRVRTHAGEEAFRSIRALLIDPQTLAIKRVLTWRVQGESTYLWKLAGNRILVHIGHELRELDSDLKPRRSIHLTAPLLWVVSSPSADHVVVRTLQERHTPEVHRQLAEATDEEPEEDTLIQVYDRNLEPLFRVQRTNRAAIPAFSDAGELRMLELGNSRWQLQEYGWDKKERTILTTKSRCRPVLSTPAPELIFMLGCSESIGHWFRMLRPDGHVLLKGDSPSTEIEQSAQAYAKGSFALRTVQCKKSLYYNYPFTRNDLEREVITIYRQNGDRRSVVATDKFAMARQTYALSPTADRLATVGRSEIHLYPVK